MVFNKFTTTGKIYVWSILLEPILFLVILDRDITGVGGNLARLLQFIVIIIILIKVLLRNYKLRIPNPAYRYYKKYFIYFSLAIFSGFYGILTNAFNFDIN